MYITLPFLFQNKILPFCFKVNSLYLTMLKSDIKTNLIKLQIFFLMMAYLNLTSFLMPAYHLFANRYHLFSRQKCTYQCCSQYSLATNLKFHLFIYI